MNRLIVNTRMIMVDFDDQKLTPEQIRRRFRWVARKVMGPDLKIRWVTYVRPSPSGRGWHFWAKGYLPFGLRRLGWKNQLLIQCLMGSDLGRERANLSRIRNGVEDWNRLFSTGRVSVKNCKFGKLNYSERG